MVTNNEKKLEAPIIESWSRPELCLVSTTVSSPNYYVVLDTEVRAQAMPPQLRWSPGTGVGTCLDMGGCQNYGPFLGTLNIRDPKRDHYFDNHPYSGSEVSLYYLLPCAVPQSQKEPENTGF